MKLIGQASHYWSNVEHLREIRGDLPVRTWTEMKHQFKEKYLPPSYYPRLLDQWNLLGQGNMPANEYVAKFDEFMVRCSTVESKTPKQILSRFRTALRIDLKIELFARDVETLERAYVLVQDLDEVKPHSSFRSQDFCQQASRSSTNQYPNWAVSNPP